MTDNSATVTENSASNTTNDSGDPPTKKQLDELKATKGQLSRQIGEAKKRGGNADDLIAQLKQVSAELKALQKAQKQLLNQSQDENPTGKSPEAPFQPSIPPFIGRAGQARVHEILANPREEDLRRAWDRYVDGHPAGTPYHRLGIRQFIETTYGHETHYLCALSENRQILGVLPLVQLKSRLFGNFVVSVPYFNYGGVLAENRDIAQQLIEKAAEWSESVDSSHVELRHLEHSELDLPARTEKVTFWLGLPETSDGLWRQFRPKLRAQIRRAEREKPEYQIGGLELLNEFYDVFATNMRDLGTPVYGKVFFRDLIEQSGLSTWLVVVRIGGKACGCAFLLGYRDRMEIPWASTLRELSSTSVNMFMYWRVLEFAIAQGFKVFDFGRCTEDAGTYRFKRQWGAEPLPMRWDYKMAPGASMPGLNPDNPKFRLLIAIWQRMPVWLTRIIGPRVVKSLP